MIKFFRKIRHDLITQNKMSKYFKYAFGEIILVVIGILIAIQVNNWNEKRIAQNQLTKLINDVDEYTESLSYGSNFYNRLHRFDSISLFFAYDSLSVKRTENLDFLRELITKDLTQYPFTKIKSDFFVGSSVGRLLNRKEELPEKYWTLIYSLESLTQGASELESSGY